MKKRKIAHHCVLSSLSQSGPVALKTWSYIFCLLGKSWTKMIMIKISICQTTRKMLLKSVKIKKKLRIGQSQLVFLMLPSQKYKFQHLIDTSPPSYGRNIVLCDTGIDIGITRKSTFYSSFLPPFLTPRFYPIILVMGGILYFAILVSIWYWYRRWMNRHFPPRFYPPRFTLVMGGIL